MYVLKTGILSGKSQGISELQESHNPELCATFQKPILPWLVVFIGSRRPSGAPEEDIRDHLHQLKLKHKKCLEFTLQTFTRQNEALALIMEEKHQEILSIKGNIDIASRDIKNVRFLFVRFNVSRYVFVSFLLCRVIGEIF